MTPQEVESRVRDFYDTILTRHELDKLTKFVDDDFVDHNPPPGISPDRAGLREAFQANVTAFPDLRADVRDVITNDDKVVVRVKLSGTHKGAYMGIPPSGARCEFECIDILRIDAGRATEHWGQADELGLMQQIGAVPALA